MPRGLVSVQREDASAGAYGVSREVLRYTDGFGWFYLVARIL